MSIGERFREIRRGKNLKQTEFSQAIGISQSALVSYERGEREPPAAAVASVCETYRISPDWLLLGRGVPYRDDDIQLVERALRLAKEHLPSNMELPTIDAEIEFTKLIYRYLIENGKISREMAEALGSRSAVNER